MRRVLFILLLCALPTALFAADIPTTHAAEEPAAAPPAKPAETHAAKPAPPAKETPAAPVAPAAPATTKAAAPPPRANKVDYLSLPTGTEWEKFNATYPGLAEKAAGLFFDLEQKGTTDFTLTIRRPRGFDGFDRFIRRMPSTIATLDKGERCGKPVEAVFLAIPRKDGERRVLYSYRYLACAGDPLVSPTRFLDKYLEKYGLYDAKDFDRNQHIYYNVQGRYEVRVRPVKEGNVAALEIGVADNAVFTEAYKAWRARLRGAEESVKEKF